MPGLGEARALGVGLAFGESQVGAGHLAHEFRERDARLPAEFSPRLGRVAEQGLHFGRAQVARVERHDGLTGARVHAALGGALAFPNEGHVEFARGGLDELPD